MPVEEKVDVLKKREELKAMLFARALANEEFRALLLAEPKKAIEQVIGGKLPEAVEVKVLEEPKDSFYLVLPRLSAGERLSEEELSKVVGGSIYMNYGGVTGDVTTAGHQNWIE